MMLVACILWVTLYSKTSKYSDKMAMRCHALERQIDLLLIHYTIDKRDIEMIERLRKMHE